MFRWVKRIGSGLGFGLGRGRDPGRLDSGTLMIGLESSESKSESKPESTKFPSKLTEEEAKELYPGFEGFIEDVDSLLAVDEFLNHCLGLGMTEFQTTKELWWQYELCCFENGMLALEKPDFLKKFKRYCRVSRPRSECGKFRLTKYEIKAKFVRESFKVVS